MRIVTGILLGLSLCFCAIGVETGNAKILLASALCSIMVWYVNIDDNKDAKK